MRDIRILNMTQGQQIEYNEVMQRIGRLENRNLSALAKIALFDEGKALITNGFRVEPYSGMTVKVPTGTMVQREIDTVGNHGDIVGVCIQTEDQFIAMDAADGAPRTDIIEGQIISVVDKTDNARIGNVVTGGGDTGSVVITNQIINRDIKYSLSMQKQKGTTTPTAATSASLTGSIAIAATIDLSEQYLLYMADGEDSDWQEIDCRGAVPAATTRAEIISAINTAVGRTMAADGAGNTVELTGQGTGERSYFAFKPPITDSNADALEVIFGVSTGGLYKWEYAGTNSWIKLAELDIGATDTEITTTMIRNLDQKGSWTGNNDEIILKQPIYNFNTEEEIIKSCALNSVRHFIDAVYSATSDQPQCITTDKNGTWVVGGDGFEQSSDDGHNWQARSMDGAQIKYGIAWGNSIFVAVGDGGEIETSPDGITWTSRTADASYSGQFTAVAYGNNLFCAAGVSVVQTSSNGITWTQRTTSYSFNDIIWSEDYQKFVGIATNFMLSSDGINWTDSGVSASNLVRLTYGNKKFVAIGLSNNGKYSENGGISWTAFSTPAPAATDDFYDIQYGNGIFVAVGGVQIMWASTDLFNWSKCVPDSSMTGEWNAIGYNNGVFIAAGNTSGNDRVIQRSNYIIDFDL